MAAFLILLGATKDCFAYRSPAGIFRDLQEQDFTNRRMFPYVDRGTGDTRTGELCLERGGRSSDAARKEELRTKLSV
jgi:hypothetical protein